VVGHRPSGVWGTVFLQRPGPRRPPCSFSRTGHEGSERRIALAAKKGHWPSLPLGNLRGRFGAYPGVRGRGVAGWPQSRAPAPTEKGARETWPKEEGGRGRSRLNQEVGRALCGGGASGEAVPLLFVRPLRAADARPATHLPCQHRRHNFRSAGFPLSSRRCCGRCRSPSRCRPRTARTRG